jgi:hypothetical protein
VVQEKNISSVMENKVNNQKFEDLIKIDKYQVFVFCCPALFPFNFARHPWFVTNKKGEISRYEIGHFINKRNKNNKYLHINIKPIFQGLSKLFLSKEYFLKAELLGFIEGDESSVTQKAIEFIENSQNTYPYCDKYHLWGPNSNTYAQNILNKFPEFNINLSWRFIGKNFQI